MELDHEEVLMNNDAEKYPAYRWIVLGSAWLVLACLVWAWFLIPSLAHYLLLDLNLNQTQFTLLLTAPFPWEFLLLSSGEHWGTALEFVWSSRFVHCAQELPVLPGYPPQASH